MLLELTNNRHKFTNWEPSCDKALQQCIRHGSCVRSWRLFIESCSVDTLHHRCNAKNETACVYAYQGLSWTPVFNCTCEHQYRNSECISAESYLKNNLCIYEYFGTHGGKAGTAYNKYHDLMQSRTSMYRKTESERKAPKQNSIEKASFPVSEPNKNRHKSSNYNPDFLSQAANKNYVSPAGASSHKKVDLQFNLNTSHSPPEKNKLYGFTRNSSSSENVLKNLKEFSCSTRSNCLQWQKVNDNWLSKNGTKSKNGVSSSRSLQTTSDVSRHTSNPMKPKPNRTLLLPTHHISLHRTASAGRNFPNQPKNTEAINTPLNIQTPLKPIYKPGNSRTMVKSLKENDMSSDIAKSMKTVVQPSRPAAVSSTASTSSSKNFFDVSTSAPRSMRVQNRYTNVGKGNKLNETIKFYPKSTNASSLWNKKERIIAGSNITSHKTVNESIVDSEGSKHVDLKEANYVYEVNDMDFLTSSGKVWILFCSIKSCNFNIILEYSLKMMNEVR
uniref:GDNF domain-containing protein n=1 Tax=Syphacia muris TaxID=451379 RepID=A0A0N5B1H1_9BILA